MLVKTFGSAVFGINAATITIGADMVDSLKIYGVENLQEVIDFLDDGLEQEQTFADTRAEFLPKSAILTSIFPM
jgi:hypothetical protein